MYEAILFDFDYTLGDSTDGIALSINYALEQLGDHGRETDEIKKTIGLSLKETYFSLTNSHDSEKAELFSRYFKEKADQVMTDHSQLYAPVEEVFTYLREKGCKVGIVTTKYHHRIDQILDKFHMASFVDIIVGSDDVKLEKPDPQGLLFAMDRLGVAKQNTLYVGDSIVDAKTAENAGVDFVGVLTGVTDRQQLNQYKNVWIAEDLSEMLDRN